LEGRLVTADETPCLRKAKVAISSRPSAANDRRFP
jgi:hypothetical protein